MTADPDALLSALRAIAIRVEAARRLSPTAGTAILRSIVDATVLLFDAEAASIALHDAATDRLVFTVAAGDQGQGVVGLSIGPAEGVAGYVFSSGQPLALADVADDARFERTTAEQTGYVPRTLVAVPLIDDEGVLGVLEVLDKRGDGSFDLRDIELASAFARQAAVAIRSSRLERDTATLLATVLTSLSAGSDDGATADAATGATAEADIEAVVAAAVANLDGDEAEPLWALADQVARIRAVDPAQLDLVRELLAVLVGRAERGHAGRSRLR